MTTTPTRPAPNTTPPPLTLQARADGSRFRTVVRNAVVDTRAVARVTGRLTRPIPDPPLCGVCVTPMRTLGRGQFPNPCEYAIRNPAAAVYTCDTGHGWAAIP